MSLKTSNIYPNFVIVEGSSEYQKGVLLPHNITYREQEISLPFALSIIRRIQQDKIPLSSFSILSRFGYAQEFAMLRYDATELLEDNDSQEELKESVHYKGTVLARTPFAAIKIGAFGVQFHAPSVMRPDRTTLIGSPATVAIRVIPA